MKLFIIPSWYPSATYPSTGIFFREQALLIAKHRPDWEIGISLWGSHDPNLWLQAWKPLTSLLRYGSKPKVKQRDTILEGNCVEFFSPAYTWTRKIKNGNIDGIVAANEKNLQRYIQYYGHPDVIHAQVVYPAGHIARELAAKFGIPYVITEHQSPFPMPSLAGLLQARLLPIIREANKVFAVSIALKNKLESYGVEATYLPNFIDDSQFLPIPSRPPIPFAISVGRLEPQKNYALMLQSAAILQKSMPFNLTIIGEGSEKNKLMGMAEKLGVEIEWLGEQPQEVVRKRLQASSLYLSTSLHENQPVAMLEAMACGLPIVSTRWDGAAEIIDGSDGQLVEQWSAESYARVVAGVLQNLPSREKVRSVFDQKYGTDQVIYELEKHYLEVITAR